MSGARHRRRPEADIQRAVFQHLRARAAPNVFAFHPANGGYRKPIEAAIMKGTPEGLDRALACLEAWGLLRGRVS